MNCNKELKISEKKVINKDGYNFAIIPQEELTQLESMSFDNFFISENEILKVHEILNVNFHQDIEYVRAIRNSIVKHFAEKMRPSLENNPDISLEEIFNINSSLSAITAALDCIIE